MKPETTTELRRLISDAMNVAKLQCALLERAEELISLAEREQWINVSERLPELYIPVALLNINKYANMGNSGAECHVYAAGTLWMNGDHSYWSVFDEARAELLTAYTHWCELPHPPDLESKNQ